jgi:hypothetical protein
MAASRSLHFQAMTMQRQSNLLMSQANKARFEGKGYKAFKLRNQARTSSSLSSAFNLGSLAISGISMALQMQEASFRDGRMQDLGFRVMAQHSIARHAENVYSGDYTYRPSTTSESQGIKLVNFESGAHKTIPTGDDMRGIGLLNLVDCQRGIFVHFGNSRAKAKPSHELVVIDTHLQVGSLSCEP